ncbi:hypothetical protein N7G274_010588 [Stereocaulon virgatum]|uniref:Uncharacterized protein n=1 Tax=Stereocaulon virgatum TaxID=373712 RepID=A0ABR3ZV17_9LECA
MLDDMHRFYFTERRNFSSRATPAADDIDRTRREVRKTLDRVQFSSVGNLEDPIPEIHEASNAHLSGENAIPWLGPQISQMPSKTLDVIYQETRCGTLDRSQYRRVSGESQKTLVGTSSKGSRSPSVEEEESLRQPSVREPPVDGAVTSPHSNKAEAAILEQAAVEVQNVQQENGRLKAENEALRAKIEELKSLKDTSEELNNAYGEQSRAEAREKAEVEQWLVEETSEVIALEQQLVDERRAYYELVGKTCQQAKKAARNMAQSKAFGRRAFERMILLCHMLTRFGVDTRDDDHEEISCQASDIVGADERIISAGFAAQARNALKELAKPEAVELRRQREIEHMENRMADVLADGNFSTCWYDGRWVNLRTGDEIKRREEVDRKGKHLGNKSADFAEEIAQDLRWIPGMTVYHRFWENSSIPSPTKAELEDVYKEDGNDKGFTTR